jgi:hypothetical protein
VEAEAEEKIRLKQYVSLVRRGDITRQTRFFQEQNLSEDMMQSEVSKTVLPSFTCIIYII